MSKVFVVTGTRKGIGAAIAEHYLAGGHVVAGCSRGEGSIEHPSYRHFQLDVSDEASVVGMMADLRRAFGRVDVLINNAGIAAMNHLLTTPASAARRVMDTNFLGSFLFLREAAKIMSRRGGGRIVNFTTVAVPLMLEGEAVYAASKAAVETLTRVAARELAAARITVNALGPVPVETDLIRTVPKDKIAALIERQPLKRLGAFEDVLNVLDFFIREESAMITGQTLYLGGVEG